ncbi:hypothetical protein [Amycolatopsis mediterranei]|uniref:Uncharacterized protein n=1 Tax=Amycolatopsis mediterranei (strain S699) TaxID=713604 RepID=A0A9R0UB23_AMYMS|nr:hypothetical protein [Amycolatopsis mediterranei]AEK44414.1 hypothetical protein RAM_29695 [Amycolatopsis mediterranei S699]KDO12836.1 hypothetical protein DV26_00160 [Amycolatopsis mediterranei]KDU88607.1 hypothetical protein DV36_28715 [Amycolatopsis mediterranei]UZF72551.1 hypothetical protein ISP_005919 [Amycolatopsis mediterranei]
MSLTDEQWDALGLDRVVVRDRAEFFIGYAGSEAPLFDVDGVIDAFRDGPLGDETDQKVAKFTDTDDAGPAGLLRRRMAEAAGRPGRRPWARTAERADALRHAAQAALLGDTREGRNLLLQSASLYRELGLPFGDFLSAAAVGPGDAAFEAAGQLRSIIFGSETAPEARRVDEGYFSLPRRLLAPAQQIAVLFTALSSADGVDGFGIGIDLLRRASQATQATSVGVTGRPVALWWECGVRLAELTYGRPSARDDLRTTIAELATAHGQALRTAQFDRYHWPRALSKMDLVDLDLTGLTAISNRVLRQLGEPEWSMFEDFRDLTPLSQVSVQVGIRLSGPGRPRTPASGPSPSPEPTPGPAAASDYVPESRSPSLWARS